MEFGMSTMQRGHATMTSNDMSNYFNQKPVIAPVRKGPRLFRKKPKVDTDLIRQSYMNDTDNNNRIDLWYANRGVNNAVKVNYGAQVINLTSGAFHNPTVPRKLEDEDYRCYDAKVRQEDLLPLSRLPRPSTSIDINKDVSHIFNKSISQYDIERQRVLHSIKGNTKKVAEAFPVQATRGIQFQNIDEYQRASEALTANATRDKMATDQLPLNVPIRTINTDNRTPLNKLRATVLQHDRQANKQLNVPGATSGQYTKDVRIIRKTPVTVTQAGKTVTMYKSNEPKHMNLVSKLKGEPHDTRKTVVLYEITDPQIHLLTKLKSESHEAPKQITMYSIDEPTNLQLDHKIVPVHGNSVKTANIADSAYQTEGYNSMYLEPKITADEERASTVVKTKSVYSDTDHQRTAGNVARFVDRVRADTSVNHQYTLGGTMDSNVITDKNVNTNLSKKNAFSEGGIDTSMFSSHREQFDRSIPFYNTDIPYTKGPGFVFVDTKPVNSRVEFYR